MKYYILFNKNVKNLKKGNNSQYRGNCPFHDEKTKGNKSFHVNIETGQYHCKSCGAKGNAITFAKHFNENINEYSTKSNNTKQKRELDNIEEYNRILNECPEYVPKTWDIDVVNILKVGFNPKEDKLVFPIYNEDGNIINVKYHNGRQFKGAKATLYPNHIIKKFSDDYIIITEGEKDAITLLSKGFQAVTATGGATTIPKDITELSRFKKIFICLDNDSAGDSGTDLWISKLKELNPKQNIRVADLSDFVKVGGDVTDYFSIKGKTSQTFIEEILEHSIWAKQAGTDVPDYLRQVMKSKEVENLTKRDLIVLSQIIIRATRYRVKTAKINGLRVSMKPGEFISTYGKLAKLCGRDMTTKQVWSAVQKLKKMGFLNSENLKMKRGMKFSLTNWIDKNGNRVWNRENGRQEGQETIYLSSIKLIKKIKDDINQK